MAKATTKPKAAGTKARKAAELAVRQTLNPAAVRLAGAREIMQQAMSLTAIERLNEPLSDSLTTEELQVASMLASGWGVRNLCAALNWRPSEAVAAIVRVLR